MAIFLDLPPIGKKLEGVIASELFRIGKEFIEDSAASSQSYTNHDELSTRHK